jgi:hypothetical protein
MAGNILNLTKTRCVKIQGPLSISRVKTIKPRQVILKLLKIIDKEKTSKGDK